MQRQRKAKESSMTDPKFVMELKCNERTWLINHGYSDLVRRANELGWDSDVGPCESCMNEAYGDCCGGFECGCCGSWGYPAEAPIDAEVSEIWSKLWDALAAFRTLH